MSDPPPRMALRRRRRTLVFGIAAVWILLLAGLTLWTANPVTLNRDQILTARANGAVIRASVIDARTGRVNVDEVLAVANGLPVDIAVGRELQAGSLSETGVKNGDRVVAPLVVSPGGDVSLAPTPNGIARTYPATPEVIGEVKRLIADARPPADND